MKNILITGGAGFIGSNFVRHMLNKYSDYNLIIYDKLTYAGNLKNLEDIMDNIIFIKGDICDMDFLAEVFDKYKIDTVVNFAAESHVDNSIKKPMIFMQTNVIGTQTLLEVARRIWGENSNNRFVHMSTDEVYGELGEKGAFTEQSVICPNSPYSASKASSDLIVQTYYKTYSMNVSIINCSNNYGPYQHNEKLIPRFISCAIKNEKLPLYGTGTNIRDWVYVGDTVEAIELVLKNGKAGEKYNIGGNGEKRNIDIAKTILRELGKEESLITFVQDRKGHDYRYSMDYSKLKQASGWEPKVKFEDGIIKTIKWYKSHKEYLIN